jgi:hypothetical protein
VIDFWLSQWSDLLKGSDKENKIIEGEKIHKNVLTKIGRLISLHGAPGYIYTAYAYLRIAGLLSPASTSVDMESETGLTIKDYYYRGLVYLYTAQNLRSVCKVSIHNAYPDGDLKHSTPWKISNFDDMITRYLKFTTGFLSTESDIFPAMDASKLEAEKFKNTKLNLENTISQNKKKILFV